MAINSEKNVLEDSQRPVNISATIYSGRPVSLNSSGEVIAATNGTVFYGLAGGDKNAFRDDTYGEFAAFGSGLLKVKKSGIVTVAPSVYSTVSGETTFQVYDTAKTYNVNDNLLVDSNGLISNAVGLTNADSIIGRVITPPSGANTTMRIDLKNAN